MRHINRLALVTGGVLSFTLILLSGLPITKPSAESLVGGAVPQHPGTVPQQPQAPPADQEWNPRNEGIGDLTGALREEAIPQAQRRRIPIVGQRFSPEQFLQYVRSDVAPRLRRAGAWKPRYIVLHNTAIPKISQRPAGFTSANMDALARYYGIDQGWRSGPHLFIDQNGIWVFSKLDSRGTHSPCFNRDSWGIEQLGDFSREPYDSGNGAKIRDNAVAAMAILSLAADIRSGPQNDNNPLRLHKEDTCTNHACPGDQCQKSWVVSAVESAKDTWRARWEAR